LCLHRRWSVFLRNHLPPFPTAFIHKTHASPLNLLV
jgi:hypothetical protein